jgi:hypothetical protein
MISISTVWHCPEQKFLLLFRPKKDYTTKKSGCRTSCQKNNIPKWCKILMDIQRSGLSPSALAVMERRRRSSKNNHCNLHDRIENVVVNIVAEAMQVLNLNLGVEFLFLARSGNMSDYLV